MDLQQQWDALCSAFHRRDWEQLDLLLSEVQSRLDAGEAPVISESVSPAFNLAMANAGLEYIRSQFSRTDEWPAIDPAEDEASRFDA